MKKWAPNRFSHHPCEEGYVLLMTIFMVAILTIGLGVAAPKVARAIQRDREAETMQRGKQYTRAIRLYYRKYGTYPSSIDALVNTGQIRFLRRRYPDPTTGLDDWKPIMLGQNKTPLAMGFFGQPLGLAGPLSPGADPGANGASGGAPFGAGGTVFGGSSDSSSSGSAGGSNGSGGSSQAGDSNSGADSNSQSGADSSGQTFGGGGIIGFSPASPKESILTYKKMDHYSKWEFLYSPLADQMTINNTPISQPPLQGGAPGAPPPTASSPVAPQ
jgi:type II secretory pathway pseudopilin PulG